MLHYNREIMVLVSTTAEAHSLLILEATVHTGTEQILQNYQPPRKKQGTEAAHHLKILYLEVLFLRQAIVLSNRKVQMKLDHSD